MSAEVFPPGVAEARRRLTVSAAVVLVGIALSAIVDQTFGGWVTVLGIVSLLHALHRFGRTGPS